MMTSINGTKKIFPYQNQIKNKFFPPIFFTYPFFLAKTFFFPSFVLFVCFLSLFSFGEKKEEKEKGCCVWVGWLRSRLAWAPPPLPLWMGIALEWCLPPLQTKRRLTLVRFLSFPPPLSLCFPFSFFFSLFLSSFNHFFLLFFFFLFFFFLFFSPTLP